MMFSLSMDHDPDPLTHLPQAAAGAQHPHILNKDKQVDKLLKNASRPDISIEVNCNDENVNIHYNPGFFDLVARKTLLTISPNHQFTAGGITFELRSSTPQTDLSGVIQSIILKFVFIRDTMEYAPQSLSITPLKMSKSKVVAQCLMVPKFQSSS